MEQRNDQRLGEHPGSCGLYQAPTTARAARIGTTELDADHLTSTANNVQELVSRREFFESYSPDFAHGVSVLDDSLVVEDRKRGEPRDHGHRIVLERRRMHHRAVHGTVGTAKDLVARQHRPDWDESARKGFGDRDDVGRQVVVLEGVKRAGPAKARLHFVADEEAPGAVPPGSSSPPPPAVSS